jgi:23S rRNA (adenine2503-C2)-methyltransferase
MEDAMEDATAHGLQPKRLQELDMIVKRDRFESRFFDDQIAYRYLYRLSTGDTIESAAYQHWLQGKPTDLAIDISMMVGCPMGCAFCESASLPYVRQLTVDEMVSQVTQLVEKHDRPPFPKLVCSFQGIGEPSLMPDKILRASWQLLALDSRSAISVATMGVRPTAFEVWRESGLPFDNLQVSCSGTTEEQIRHLMPHSPGLDRLVEEALHCAELPQFPKVKLNYLLIRGFNDSDEDVERLVKRLKSSSLIAKISTLNPTQASRKKGLTPGSLARAQAICELLQSHGIDSYVYGAHGQTTISCGQLAFVETGGTT